jgi:hypothetical protein
MQWHQPCLAELRVADGQDRRREIDVGQLEVARLAQTQPGDAQQAEQTIIDPWAQAPAGIATGQAACSVQQGTDLRIRVQVRPRAGRTIRQQACGRNLGARIRCAPVTGEATDDAQPSGPLGRLHRRRLLGPGQRQRRGDSGGSLLFHERCKGEQPFAGIVQPEPQASAQSQILVDGRL